MCDHNELRFLGWIYSLDRQWWLENNHDQTSNFIYISLSSYNLLYIDDSQMFYCIINQRYHIRWKNGYTIPSTHASVLETFCALTCLCVCVLFFQKEPSISVYQCKFKAPGLEMASSWARQCRTTCKAVPYSGENITEQSFALLTIVEIVCLFIQNC